MDKVKITKEQESEFIKLTMGLDNEFAIKNFLKLKEDLLWSVRLKDISVDLFLGLLVNGYEIIDSPEERLLKLYNKHKDNHSTHSTRYVKGMTGTLYILGIKIEGIEF